MGMFEVAVPAFQSRIERRNHAIDRMSAVTLRLGADPIAQRHQTFLAHPTLPCFEPVPQKLEPLPFDTAVPDMRFVRMQGQSVRAHPSAHPSQRRLRFLPTATQHHGVIRVQSLRESLHAHPVYVRRPSVAFDLCPSQPQRFKARHLVDQTMPFASLNSDL